MTQEDILDSSLRFLGEKDEGSFSYYKDEDNSIKFLPHLTSLGVSEKDWLKTILHLANDGYIEVSPELNSLKGHYPKQIKITSQGKIFINKGGYNNVLRIEKRDNRRFYIPIILSITALMVSILSYLQNYKSNHPDISLTNDKLISAVFRDTTGQKRFFGFQRATITNDGGKPVTLRGFIPQDRFDLFLLTENGSNKIVNHNVTYKVFIIPDTLMSEKLFSKERNLSFFKNEGLESLSMLNKVIKPGEVCPLSIGFVLDVFSDTTKHYSSVFFCGQLYFSNGQKLDFGSAGDIGKPNRSN